MTIDYSASSAQLFNTMSVCFISGKFCFVLSTTPLKMSTAIKSYDNCFTEAARTWCLFIKKWWNLKFKQWRYLCEGWVLLLHHWKKACHLKTEFSIVWMVVRNGEATGLWSTYLAIIGNWSVLPFLNNQLLSLTYQNNTWTA